ncbi:DUF6597 domain-containing transcriptional factor [Pedobacter antarcticus]|uniref:DUF6597 domain-containing transcriptional factor n=1 Tax=Pedobacter antarcticus TaxID=34086 RepID=UPI001C5923EB|nr:helix-turn-helix transcriptional regulator [Pedobacter antarcticus]
MEYQVYEPNENLSPFIKCYWTLEGPKERKPQKQTIVPDGCMEMIFHYGDLYKQYVEEGNSIIQPRSFIIGQLTRPLDIEPTQKTGIFAVRFRPEGFLPFATLPIKELENKAVSLEILYNKSGLKIEQEILTAKWAQERIQKIELFLASFLKDTKTIDHIVQSTIDTILMANGKLQIVDLGKLLNINRRQIERRFSAKIGLSPKQLSKIIKLQAALKILLNADDTNLTSLAYVGEYYDQAHFIRDFKEFTGVTPKEFYSNNLKLSSLFYGME